MFLVGFEVLIEVVMNSIIFWDIAPCIPLSQVTSTCFSEASGILGYDTVTSVTWSLRFLHLQDRSYLYFALKRQVTIFSEAP